MNRGWGNVFDVQRYNPTEERIYAKRNLAADLFFSRLAQQDPERFAREYPDCAPFIEKTAKTEERLARTFGSNHPLHQDFQEIGKFPFLDLEKQAKLTKSSAIDQIRIFTSSNCEATCPKHCYTKSLLDPSKKDETALTDEQRRRVITEAKNLGANLLYVAGRGEPFADPGFMKMVEFARDQGLDVMFFTNGLALSNNEHAQRLCGTDSDSLVRWMVDQNVHAYHKLWSTDRETQERMMAIRDPNLHYGWVEYTFNDGKKVGIPASIAKHMMMGDVNKVGVETVVDANTVLEVRNKIIPFIQSTGIRSYVEPFITSGRGASHPKLVPRQEDISQSPISDYIVRGGCRLTAHTMTVLEDGTMSFCLSVEPERMREGTYGEHLQVFRNGGSLKDLWALNHSHPLIVTPFDITTRYQGFCGECQCQTVNEALHGLPKLYQITAGEKILNSTKPH